MASSLARTRSKQLSYTRVTDKIIHNEDIYASIERLINIHLSNRLLRAPSKSLLVKIPQLSLRYFYWWRLPDSNWGHKALQASALPTELKRHGIGHYNAVLVWVPQTAYACGVLLPAVLGVKPSKLISRLRSSSAELGTQGYQGLMLYQLS